MAEKAITKPLLDDNGDPIIPHVIKARRKPLSAKTIARRQALFDAAAEKRRPGYLARREASLARLEANPPVTRPPRPREVPETDQAAWDAFWND